MDTIPRRSGVKLDSERIDFELGRRGVTARRLSALTGIAEATLSRARHGRPISEANLRRLTQGLLGIPLLVGADMLIAEPTTTKAVGVAASPTTSEEASNGGPSTAATSAS